MKRIGIVNGMEASTFRNYDSAVAACGAIPVALLQSGGPEQIEALDGVLLPGGWDIDPARYGEADTACQNVDPALDALEWAVVDAALRWHKPVFGICRGLQLLNVYFGGSLQQDIQAAAVHTGGKVGEVYHDKVHGSRAAAGGFLHGVYGAERFPVNSSHHQAIKALGEGICPVQYSDDGLIEGICHRALPIWAVQWHPERMCLGFSRPDTVDGARLLGWFVEQC